MQNVGKPLALAGLLFAGALCANTVHAAPFVVTVSQQGGNVVAAGSGAFDVTGLTKVVTANAKISGYSSTKTGKRTVNVSYTENGVTKSTTFTTLVGKAASGVALTASKSTLKVKKTRATVTADVVSATGVVPTGKVKFYLGKKLVKSVKLKSGQTTVKVKYPAVEKKGTYKVTVKYSGSSLLEKSQKSLKLKVKK